METTASQRPHENLTYRVARPQEVVAKLAVCSKQGRTLPLYMVLEIVEAVLLALRPAGKAHGPRAEPGDVHREREKDVLRNRDSENPRFT